MTKLLTKPSLIGIAVFAALDTVYYIHTGSGWWIIGAFIAASFATAAMQDP